MANHIDPKLIAKVKEWAAWQLDRTYTLPEPNYSVIQASEFITALPDQIVDADKLQEEADRMDTGAANAMKPGNNEFSRGYSEAMKECAEHVRALLPPPLPTLADMTPEARAKCQWMQATHVEYGIGVIASMGPMFFLMLFNDGRYANGVSGEDVIPHSDLPRLVWPAESHPEPAEEPSTQTRRN